MGVLGELCGDEVAAVLGPAQQRGHLPAAQVQASAGASRAPAATSRPATRNTVRRRVACAIRSIQ